ncbi:hypothetical protein [Prevotella intermedia]|uniref:hypothetical protein n=1 Tax=Prevotella intermedia TaxID=28131 RepID=UPI000BE72FF5|nr:hypothetical protein [Prevotella intermedia]PDP68568.1 hypothetical protein CLI70_05330 [Prevotella intermedia]
MVQKHLILVDEQSQKDRLKRISESLKKDGIELIYEEINPNDCSSRLETGDLYFDKDALMRKLKSINFLSHLDVFATDYNLVEDELKGEDLIKMLYELLPYYRNKVIVYSAQIEDVITNIIKRADGFEEQITMLKLLAQNEINYLRSDGEFENKIKKLIIKEPELTIDSRLADSLCAIDNEDFRCIIEGYTDKKISEIGNMLLTESEDAIALRRYITEHIMAMITSIRGYE